MRLGSLPWSAGVPDAARLAAYRLSYEEDAGELRRHMRTILGWGMLTGFGADALGAGEEEDGAGSLKGLTGDREAPNSCVRNL
jgi:hypothetical protein